MAEVWSSIIDAFFTTQESLSGVLVSVRYPDGTTLNNVTVIPATVETEMVLENGVGIEAKMQTFQIAREELPSEPVRDLEIVWKEKGQRYIVLHPGGGKVWEWDDHYHNVYIVRAQAIGGSVFQQSIYGSPSGDAYGTSSDEAYAGPEV